MPLSEQIRDCLVGKFRGIGGASYTISRAGQTIDSGVLTRRKATP